MEDVATLIRRLMARYRRRLILRAIVGAALGMACVTLLILRLRQAGMTEGRVMLISLGAVAGIVAWQWRSIRRDAWQRVKVVADLDRALGLDARLLTAVEFADAPDPPALYPRLLEDTSKALPDIQRRLPRMLDRPGAVLAAITLVLLLWPQAHARLQLAMSPPTVMPPETPPPHQPDQQSKQDQQQNQNQSGGQNQPPQGSGSKDQQQKPQQQAGKSGDQSNPSQDSQGNQHSDKSQQTKEQSGSSGKQSQQQSGQSQQQSGQQQTQAGKDNKSGAAGEQASAQAKGSDKGNQKNSTSGESNTAPGMNAGSPSDAAQQQALKADIQQLLKELSSELKNMQAEMEAKQSNSQEPSPLAGGATDPNLYEQSAKLDTPSGSRLPIQLEVDTTPTTSPRRGGGTGQPSKQASDALPQQEPENASLSDVRTTEQGQARHAIPPEYQPVFERLSPNQQHNQQP